MSDRELRSPSADEDVKPDIFEKGEKGPLSPTEVMRRERETYGDDSTFPNREDIEDEHSG